MEIGDKVIVKEGTTNKIKLGVHWDDFSDKDIDGLVGTVSGIYRTLISVNFGYFDMAIQEEFLRKLEKTA